MEIWKLLIKKREWSLQIGLLNPSLIWRGCSYEKLFSTSFSQKAERLFGEARRGYVALRPPQRVSDCLTCWGPSWMVLNGHFSFPFEVEDLWRASFSTNPFLLRVGRYFLLLLNRFPRSSLSLDPDSTWLFPVVFLWSRVGIFFPQSDKDKSESTISSPN